MISTIGSLVQGMTSRRCWLVATSIYIIACSSTSVLLGASLSAVGHTIHRLTCGTSTCVPLSSVEMVLVGMVGIAYALSDIGMVKVPRPRMMHAVPVTWWRQWKPYGAALAYGATLGIGVTTEIQFGAFYVLCLLCMVKGEIVYGALMMGTYGIARSLTILPASWVVYMCCTDSSRGLRYLLNSLSSAKLIMAAFLIFFGIQVFVSVLF